MSWLSALVGGICGLIVKIFYDRLKAPSLKITEVNPVAFELLTIGGKYHAYRVRVLNEQRLSEAAGGCVVWLRLDSASEDYQLSWIGSSDPSTAEINIGDSREFDLCAIHAVNGTIVSTTERGYFQPTPREIGSATNVLRGVVRITCRNGKKAEKRVEIRPSQDVKGEYFLEVILTEVVSEKNERSLFGPVTAGAIFFTLFATLLGYGSSNIYMQIVMWGSLVLSIVFLLTVIAELVIKCVSNRKIIMKPCWISISRNMKKWKKWIMTFTAQSVLQMYFLGFVITWLIALDGKSGWVVSMTFGVGFVWFLVLIGNGLYSLYHGRRVD